MSMVELRELRKKTGRSLGEVAEVIGMSRQKLALIERGESDVRVGELCQLGEAYGYRLEVLLTKEGSGRRLEVRLR